MKLIKYLKGFLRNKNSSKLNQKVKLGNQNKKLKTLKKKKKKNLRYKNKDKYIAKELKNAKKKYAIYHQKFYN